MYVSLLSNCTLLAELTDSLRGLVTNPSLAGGCFAVNDAVVALFEGMPGRGLVSALLPNKMIKVKFVDFGNFELFNAADLWKLSGEYLNIPQLAIKCRLDLDGVELAKEPETVVQYLKTEYPDVKEVRCVFVRKEEETHVIRLCTEGGEEEVSKLVAAGLVRSKGGPLSQPSGRPPLSKPSGPPPLSKPSGPPLLTSFSNKRKVVYFKPSCVTLEVGATFSTAICNIENPTTIIANFLTPMQDKATEFLQHVQVGGEGIETFAASGTTPELDQLVLCFSGEFQEWFRARVKSAGGE
ncbi:uncharacterized protein LOC134823652 [Bolinopsis microptera]|uniref:uncharacterized protein LOC134823652 n=1 Tax=Bolinopsis microptera TaxID=2820187 RepID=UPI003079C746